MKDGKMFPMKEGINIPFSAGESLLKLLDGVGVMEETAHRDQARIEAQLLKGLRSKLETIVKETCPGCMSGEPQPNQLAHIDGACCLKLEDKIAILFPKLISEFKVEEFFQEYNLDPIVTYDIYIPLVASKETMTKKLTCFK